MFFHQPSPFKVLHAFSATLQQVVVAKKPRRKNRHQRAFSNDLGPAHDTGLQWIIEGLQKFHDHFPPGFFRQLPTNNIQ